MLDFRYNSELREVLKPRQSIFRTCLHYFWWATVPIISPLLLLAVFVYYLYDSASQPLKYEAWQADMVSIF